MNANITSALGYRIERRRWELAVHFSVLFNSLNMDSQLKSLTSLEANGKIIVPEIGGVESRLCRVHQIAVEEADDRK